MAVDVSTASPPRCPSQSSSRHLPPRAADPRDLRRDAVMAACWWSTTRAPAVRQTELRIVVNWFDELQRKMSGGQLQ